MKPTIESCAVVLSSALLHGCCCCGCPGGQWGQSSDEYFAEQEAERAAAVLRAPGYIEAIQSLHQWADTEDYGPVHCPEDPFLEIGSEFFQLTLWTADWDGLPGSTTGREHWEWLDHTEIEYVRRLIAADPTDSSLSLLPGDVGVVENRYLVVFKADDKAMPTDAEAGLRGRSYTKGVFQGGLLVADLQERRIICKVPLVTHSSDGVEPDDGGLLATTYQDALDEDFKRNVGDDARGALSLISDRIDVVVVGLF